MTHAPKPHIQHTAAKEYKLSTTKETTSKFDEIDDDSNIISSVCSINSNRDGITIADTTSSLVSQKNENFFNKEAQKKMGQRKKIRHTNYLIKKVVDGIEARPDVPSLWLWGVNKNSYTACAAACGMELYCATTLTSHASNCTVRY